MQRLLMDLRYALRQLVRTPSFSVPVLLILAVGIGAAAAVVSTVDHVLFRPLDLPNSERLVTLCEVHGQDRTYCSVSTVNMNDWAHARSIESMGAARYRGLEIHGSGGRTEVLAAMATPGFLEALGVAPLHGRLLTDRDMMPAGGADVVVLSHELWQEQFGGDPGVVGREIRVSSGGDGRVLRDHPFGVVGVLPAGVEVPRLEGVRAWFPLQHDAAGEEHRGWRGFVGLARLRPGSTPEAAHAELNALQRVLADEHPAELRNWAVDVHLLRDYLVADVRPLLMLFLGAVGLVLAIVCVNAITLLLARGARRARELAILAALGARRRQLTQQLVIESLLITVAGAGAGLLVARGLIAGARLLAPPGVPRIDEVAIDGRVLAIMAAVTVGCGLLFGVVPALRLRFAGVHDALRQGRSSTPDRSGQRVRRALVVTQLALALALLLSASLLLRSFGRLAGYDPGFRMDGLLTFQVYPPMWRYESREQLMSFYERTALALAGIPGVRSVGSTSAGPLIGGGDGATPFLLEGVPGVDAADAPRLEWFDAGPGYFPTLGVPLLAGRQLSAAPASPEVHEALINRSAARRYWGDASPLGARLELPDWGVHAEIVGIVPDIPGFGSHAAAAPAIYVSTARHPRGASFFVMRTDRDPESLAPVVRRVLAEIDPDVMPYRLSTMRELLHGELAGPRFNVALIGAFAALALLLSTAGVYALVAYTVTLRTREFGIRLALGARSGRVLLEVLRDSGRLIAGGILLGGLAGYYFTRLLRGLLVEVAPTDALASGGAVALLAVVAVVATLLPARHAARTSPADVLRAE